MAWKRSVKGVDRMKKTKRIVALLLAAVLAVGCLGFAAYANDQTEAVPTVTFDVKTGKFSFDNVAFYTATTVDENGNEVEEQRPDLFTEFKNAMPGDNIYQRIRVVVKNAGSNTVKVMLRAGNSNEDFATLMGMKVTYNKETKEPTWEADPAIKNPATLNAVIPKLNGEKLELNEAGAVNWLIKKVRGVLNLEKTKTDPYYYSGTLAEGVYLGAYTGSSEQEIGVTLAIPKAAGNELAGLQATVDWVFTAEVIPPYNPTDPDIPDEPTPTLDTVNHFAYIIGRKDGLVHPEAPITRGEVATIYFRMLTDESREQLWSKSNPYLDVAPNLWCNAAISTMTVGGIVQGFSDGTFRPYASITRAQFAAMAVRFFDVEYDGPDMFSDISGHWAADLINKAASAGIILGFKDGTFRPDQNITRAEAIAIFNRVLGRAPDKDHLLDNMITWPDNMDTNAWYYANMQEATNSHDYDRVKAADGTEYEVWTKLLPVRDWAAFETEWATAGSAKNPGDVYSSR